MNFDGLKDAIVQMLTGERCKVDIATFENDLTSFECRDDVLTILIHLGYLAYDYGKKEAYVPNEEMMEAFCRAIKGTGWTSVIEAVNCTGIL